MIHSSILTPSLDHNRPVIIEIPQKDLLLEEIWLQRPVKLNKEFVSSFLSCLIKKEFSSQLNELEEWVQDLLLAVEQSQSELLVDLINGKQRAFFSLPKWLTKFSHAIQRNVSDQEEKQEHVLENLVKNVGLDNALA